MPTNQPTKTQNAINHTRRIVGGILPGPLRLSIHLLARALYYGVTRQDPSDPKNLHTFWDCRSAIFPLDQILTRHTSAGVQAAQLSKSGIFFHVLLDCSAHSPQTAQSDLAQDSATPLSQFFSALLLNPQYAGSRFYFDAHEFQSQYAALQSAAASLQPVGGLPPPDPAPSLAPSQQAILQHFEKTSQLPRPRVPVSIDMWAKGFLAARPQTFILCVHFPAPAPGNAPAPGSAPSLDPSQDPAAHLQAWLEFLASLQQLHPDVLVVILGGPTLYPPALSRLTNCLILQALGFGLLQEMAIVQEADLFMGVPAGPAQYAYFGYKPYVIIDSPQSHPHASAARALPPDATHPPFASPGQRIHVANPTPQQLLELFENARAGK